MVKPFANIAACLIIMIIVLIGISKVIPLSTTSRLSSIIVIGIYALIGSVAYIFCAFKLKIIDDIFGKEKIKSIFIKIKDKVVMK